MAALPFEVLLGLYLGLLTGIVPAVVAWTLGFGFRYFTGITIPGFAVVVLGVAIAGVNGGLLGLIDQNVTQAPARVAVAVLVVFAITLYAHAQGDKLGANLPKRVSLRQLTERTLSTDVVELVGGRGQVRVRVTGEVADVEGYPPLPVDLRTTIREATWTFPADVPLSELETRVADRLRTDHDLSAVSVRLDERARAEVAAAPPLGALSKRVPSGERAVSLTTLVPTGLAPGDEVTVAAGDADSAVPAGEATDAETTDSEARAFEATVLGVKAAPTATADADAATDSATATDGGDDLPTPPRPTPTAAGGESRVTLAVDRADATALLSADPDRLVVRSRGVRREFELVSLLRRAGRRFRRLTVREGGALDGTTLGEASVRDTYGVAVLAVRQPSGTGGWKLAPEGSTELHAGDDLFAVGTRDELARFEEVVA
ncbi:potassium channel family protein [Salinirubrum litoreum]|uniref:Potassium channel family protein n=1 Tax=Salinirubrum litoreum TaxID=1126234 RepID=A0ABD5RBB5_9EURY|nr:TrkA C-terminal domain-containing protein [Salinirubrum litoreum]